MIAYLEQFPAVHESAGRGEIRGQRPHRHWTAIARDRYDHLGAGVPVPLPEHFEAPFADLAGHLGVGSIGGEERSQALPLSEVGEAGDGASFLGEIFGGDPTLERNPDVGQSTRPGTARFDGQADLVQVPGRRLALFVGDLGREPHSRTVVAAAAEFRVGIVELTDEELHPTLPGRLIIEHGLGLFGSDGRDLLIAFPVVGPAQPGRDVPAFDLRHRVFDFEGLEQQVETGAFGSDQSFQAGHGQGAVRLGEGCEHGVRIVLIGHRRSRKVLPDLFVFRSGQQQDIGGVCGAAGSADLLVVSHG